LPILNCKTLDHVCGKWLLVIDDFRLPIMRRNKIDRSSIGNRQPTSVSLAQRGN
jgi:hypothetical protein